MGTTVIATTSTSTSTTTFALRRVLAHEWRVLTREAGLWIWLALWLACLAAALHVGLAETRKAREMIAAVQAEEAARMERLPRQLAGMLAGTEKPDVMYANPQDPAHVGSALGAPYAVLPVKPTAALALGQLDLLPQYLRVTFHARIGIGEPSTVANPWQLLSGHFDLAFVLIYLLPLFAVALTHDLLAGERERGTLALLMAQGLPLKLLLGGKLLLRFALLAVPVLLPAVWLGAVAQAPLAELVLWWLAAAGYAAFWLALGLAVNRRGLSSAGNALRLVSLWVLLVLVAPVLLDAAIVRAHPAPARAELVSAMRDADRAAERRYGKMDTVSHAPEQEQVPDGKVFIHPYVTMTWLRQREVAAATDGLLAHQEAQQQARQRTLARWGWVTPAALLHSVGVAVAGTDETRHQAFRQQMTALHEARKAFFYPRVLAQDAMTAAAYAAMPRYRWQEPARAGWLPGAVLQALWLWLMAVGLLLLPGAGRAGS